jgi:hypothetical protein
MHLSLLQTALLRVDPESCQLAAFLTQTVTLDDQTTVKFEIWYVSQSIFSI